MRNVNSKLLAVLLVSFVLLITGSPTANAADAAKLRTLSGTAIEGELVSMSSKEIVIRSKDGEVTTPITDVLDVEFTANTPTVSAPKFTDVELTDGTLLHCSQFGLKNKEVEVKLLSGQDVKLPLAAVNYVLHDAHDAEMRNKWQRFLSKQSNHDLLVDKKNLNTLPGTFGSGDDKGETIEFELNATRKVRIDLTLIQGLSFFRQRVAGDEPLCKVHDATRNLIVASKIEKSDNGYTLTTSSGVKITYFTSMLARLDFSKGKLTYLSDLEPIRKMETSALEGDGIDHYRRDKNLDGGPLRLAGQTYAKGLSMHAYTELVYDIGGAYKEFKAMLGVDEQVGGDTHVKVTIEGDNKELYMVEVKRKDKKVIPIAIDVRNVKQLRIVVSSANLLDLGDHVELADAKVSK